MSNGKTKAYPKRHKGFESFRAHHFSSEKLHFLASPFFCERFRLLPFGKNG